MIESLNLNTERNTSFDEQWDKPEQLQIGSKLIEVQDIHPETQKTDIPMIIGLGWSETPEANKQNIRTYTEKGRRVISPNTPHGIDAQHIENYPAVELRKMTALIETLGTKGIEKSDIVAHSEGAVFAVMAAYLYPEKFRNLILINPAGMIGEDSVPRLAVGFAADLIKQIITETIK